MVANIPSGLVIMPMLLLRTILYEVQIVSAKMLEFRRWHWQGMSTSGRRKVGRAYGIISKSICLCTANAERVLARKKDADGILRVSLALDTFFLFHFFLLLTTIASKSSRSLDSDSISLIMGERYA